MNTLCTSVLLAACLVLAACNKPSNVTMTPDTPAVSQNTPANTGTGNTGTSTDTPAMAPGTAGASSDAGAASKPAN